MNGKSWITFCGSFLFMVTGLEAACPAGFFGDNCEFQCFCKDKTDCDPNGVCPLSKNMCADKYFGQTCSFRDEAFESGNPLTDNKEETCLDATSNKRDDFEMIRETKLSFVEITTKQSDVFDKVCVRFLDAARNELRNKPGYARTYLDKYHKKVIIHGKLERRFKYVRIYFPNGEVRKQFCSMHVSGGRNMALKEKVTVYPKSDDANLTVDGIISNDTKMCAFSDQRSSFWTLRTDDMLDVNFWRIWTNEENMCRMMYYRLQSYSGFRLVQMEQGRGLKRTPFTINADFAFITWMTISFDPKFRPYKAKCDGKDVPFGYSLCEVEMYGDEVCPEGSWGFECSKKCPETCLKGCIGSTGTCFECKLGYTGPECETLVTEEAPEVCKTAGCVRCSERSCMRYIYVDPGDRCNKSSYGLESCDEADKDPTCDGGCQVFKLNKTGVLTSPNYPDNYPDLALVKYHITAPEGFIIFLIFRYFALERFRDNQYYDFIKITEAVEVDNKVDGKFIGQFAGDEVPKPIKTTTRHLTLYFESDYSNSFKGFSIEYTFERSFSMEASTSEDMSPAFKLTLLIVTAAIILSTLFILVGLTIKVVNKSENE